MNRTLATAFLTGAVAATGVLRADVPSYQLVPIPTLQSNGNSPGSVAPPASDAPDAARPLYAEDATTEPAAAAPAAKKIGGSFAATLTSKYISRGLILNNSGAIVQPSAELDFNLFESKDGPINSISPYIGVWSDLTDNHRFAHSTLSSWYEFDWDVGASVTFLNNWNFNVQYIEFTSPSSAFGTSKNIIPQLTFDDSSLWTSDQAKNLAFGLHPYVAGLLETNGKAGSGAKLGQYVEPGLNPSVTFGASGSFPITLTVPMKIGLGFSNFYGGSTASHNETLGYESIGVQIAFPVKFIDATIGGAWSVNVGGAYYHYENGTHPFNVANVGYTSRDDAIGAVGLLCKF